MAGVQIDGVNNKIDFDDDLDTSISANTDDTLVFEIAGATDFTMTANTFTAASGSTIAAQALTATTVTASGEIDGGSLDISGDADIDGTTNLDVVDIDGAVNMATTALVTGVLTTTAATVFNGGFASNAASTITTADNTDTLSLVSTDADGSSGPNLKLYRNSGSPADGDTIGDIGFTGRNDNSQDVEYARIFSTITDASDGTEDGRIDVKMMVAGTAQSIIKMLPTETVFNEDSIDLDFRVESNGNANMLFVNGGTNRVHFGGSSGDREFNFEGADNLRLLLRTNDNSVGACQLQFGDSDNSQIGRIMYEHDDNNMTFHTNATQFMELTSTGKVVLSGNTASSTSDLTSGGLHFHDASTSAGNIMPITFTPSATADRARAGIGFISQSASGSAGFAADIAFYARSAADGTTMGTDDEALRINSNHEISTKETDPDVSSGGLCLNQGSQDGFIFTAKSSDIAHGNTDTLETDSYFGIGKSSSDSGGVTLAGVTEHNQSIDLLALFTNANTTTGTSATGVVRARAWLKSGTGSTASLNADQNIFTAGAGNDVKFIVKADGDIFYDGADQGAYDSYDDAMLVRSWDLSHNKNVIDSKFDAFVKYNHEDLAKAELVGREEDGTPNHFISLTGMQRLHNGAIWQQYEKTEKLANAMYELAKAAVGEDKANEILEQNEIKLLN